MPKISVIIPIYSTEAYVERCLRSVMNQSLHEIEILCIDDCSPDNSAAIVERLAAEDDRIQLVRHQENLGLGGARNTGIEAARARYLASVDSDDFIKPRMLERLWDATRDGVADVVACGFSIVTEKGELIRDTGPRQVGWHENDANQLDIFDTMNPAFWNKLWRRDLFIESGVRFPEKLYYEDLATTPRILQHARTICIIPDFLYNYVVRDGSITNSVSPQHVIDYFRAYDTLDFFLEKKKLGARYESAFKKKIGESLSYLASRITNSDMEEDQKAQYLRHILMFKISYLTHRDFLREVEGGMLQTMIRDAASRQEMEALLATHTPPEQEEG